MPSCQPSAIRSRIGETNDSEANPNPAPATRRTRDEAAGNRTHKRRARLDMPALWVPDRESVSHLPAAVGERQERPRHDNR